jgi:hypothetical protein
MLLALVDDPRARPLLERLACRALVLRDQLDRTIADGFTCHRGVALPASRDERHGERTTH